MGERMLGNAWEGILERKPALRGNSILDAMALGVLPGLVGGLQHVVADFVWLRMYQRWSERDVEETRTLITAATTLDPGAFYFRRHGARIIAFDLPVWRVRQEEVRGSMVQESRRAAIREEEAARAIALLRAGVAVQPDNPEIWLEVAQIHLHARRDYARAAHYFLVASQMEGAPFYAARLHAELLRRLGQEENAYRFYRELHPSLPRDNPAAAAEVVLQRIRDLEAELGVPPEGRYRGTAPGTGLR